MIELTREEIVLLKDWVERHLAWYERGGGTTPPQILLDIARKLKEAEQ